MRNRTVMLGLGYAGLLPFYGFLAGAWLLSDWPGAVSVQGFVIYSLGILCFLGGTLWGRVQTVEEPLIARLLISNGVVLFAVAAVLTAKAWLAAVALMGGIWRYFGTNVARNPSHMVRGYAPKLNAGCGAGRLVLRTPVTSIPDLGCN